MTTKERPDRHDRQIAVILTLLKGGKKMLDRIQRVALETRKDLRELAAAQKRTDSQLQALVVSLRRGGNGHGKKPADLLG